MWPAQQKKRNDAPSLAFYSSFIILRSALFEMESMKPVEKALTTCLWIVFVLAMVSVIGAGLWNRGRLRGGENAVDTDDELATTMTSTASESRDPLAAIAEVPAFVLVDQNDKPL